jgi:hypothetical protein
MSVEPFNLVRLGNYLHGLIPFWDAVGIPVEQADNYVIEVWYRSGGLYIDVYGLRKDGNQRSKATWQGRMDIRDLAVIVAEGLQEFNRPRRNHE